MSAFESQGRTAGVLVVEDVAAAAVAKNKTIGPVRVFPDKGNSTEAVLGMPADEIVVQIASLVRDAAQQEVLHAVRVG